MRGAGQSAGRSRSAPYGQFEGVQVPTEGTGVWNYATGDYTYIHWRLTDVQYDRPQRY
jgi:hypothetical protein